MDNVEFIEHKGVPILRIEFPDGTDTAGANQVIAAAKQFISGRPPASVRTMTVIGKFYFNNEIAAAFREFIAHNKPYVKAGAVLGVTGLRKALYNSYMLMTKRNIKICQTEEEAREFLAGIA